MSMGAERGQDRMTLRIRPEMTKRVLDQAMAGCGAALADRRALDGEGAGCTALVYVRRLGPEVASLTAVLRPVPAGTEIVWNAAFSGEKLAGAGRLVASGVLARTLKQTLGPFQA